MNYDKETDYSINTGVIFTKISDSKNWEKFKREFLIKEVQTALRRTLFNRRISSVAFDGYNGSYLKTQFENAYPKDVEAADDLKRFPFPTYFFTRYENDEEYRNIVEFEEDCRIDINDCDKSFDLYFALQFFLTDIMETEGFLNFHLENSFSGNRIEYKTYLIHVCIKYNDFLFSKKKLINLYIKKFLFKNNIDCYTININDLHNNLQLHNSQLNSKIQDSKESNSKNDLSEEKLENKKNFEPKLIDEITQLEFNESLKCMKKYENRFCKSMPVDIAIEHFKVFTQKNSKNDKPYLSRNQFISFFNRAFFKDNYVKKIVMNVGSREKSYIIKRFYEFYSFAINGYESTSQCKDKYIRLVSDNFSNWTYESIKDNFNAKATKQW